MVPLLCQLWGRVSDKKGPLHQGTRQQVERGGQPALPCHRQETLHSPGLQRAAVWPVDDDPVGASESKRSSDVLSDSAMAVPFYLCPTFPAFLNCNLSVILLSSATVSVWVRVWLRSTDTFTAVMPTLPKFLTGCAVEF